VAGRGHPGQQGAALVRSPFKRQADRQAALLSPQRVDRSDIEQRGRQISVIAGPAPRKRRH
jgi:hypothetical protein